MNAKEEYNTFIDYYYFDYNIMNSIISFFDYSENDAYITSFCIYTVLNSFYDMNKICIPYSKAHVWDINQGTEKSNQKINIVQKLSKCWFVSEDYNQLNKIRVDKMDDIYSLFDEELQTMKELHDIQNVFSPFIEIAFETSIENYKNSECFSDNLQRMILEIYHEKKIKTIYDLFQFNYKMINILNIKKYIDIDNISSKNVIQIIESFFDDNLLLKSINIKSISDFKILFYNNLNNFAQSDFSKNVFMYSFLCDYLGITREKKEKVYKDTFVSSMINDLIHLSIGLRCHCFITNDKNLRKKAVICKNLLDLHTRIFNGDDFYQHLINEYYKYTYNNEDQKEFELKIEINGKKYSKKLKTDFSKKYYL